MTVLRQVKVLAGVLAAMFAAAAPGVRSAMAVEASAPAEQGAGNAVYAEKCAGCHGAELGGVTHAPALLGPTFRNNWRGKTARNLYSRIISTMPAGDPGSLEEDEALAVTLYLLERNGAALPGVAKPDALNSVSLTVLPE